MTKRKLRPSELAGWEVEPNGGRYLVVPPNNVDQRRACDGFDYRSEAWKYAESEHKKDLEAVERVVNIIRDTDLAINIARLPISDWTDTALRDLVATIIASGPYHLVIGWSACH